MSSDDTREDTLPEFADAVADLCDCYGAALSYFSGAYLRSYEYQALLDGMGAYADEVIDRHLP